MRVVLLTGVLMIVALAGCGGSPSAPDDISMAPPVQIVPLDPVPLPSNAPADAAAPVGTRRLTITTLVLTTRDGTRVQPDALTNGVSYAATWWVFVPRGLENTYFTDLLGGGFHLAIPVEYPAGYSTFGPFSVNRSGGASPYVLEILESPSGVSVARREVTLVAN